MLVKVDFQFFADAETRTSDFTFSHLINLFYLFRLQSNAFCHFICLSLFHHLNLNRSQFYHIYCRFVEACRLMSKTN